MRRFLSFTVAAVLITTPQVAATQPRLVLFASTDSAIANALLRAERAFAEERWVDAAELYQRAMSSEDAVPGRWRSLGDALFNAGRQREAIAAYERALQLGGEAPETAAWQIARAYARVGNAKQAVRWRELAVQLGFDDSEALRREQAFVPYVDDSRFSVRGDTRARGRRSPSRARHTPVAKVDAA